MNLLKESCYEKEKYMRIPTETAKHLYYCAQWTGHFICKSDFRIKRSDFPGFLLIYTSSGIGNLIYKGSKYHIGANSFCLLDCLTPHEYTTTAAPWDFKFLHFCGNSSCTIEQISENCGFGSCNSFIRTFKNTTGTTPMKYRRHS